MPAGAQRESNKVRCTTHAGRPVAAQSRAVRSRRVRVGQGPGTRDVTEHDERDERRPPRFRGHPRQVQVDNYRTVQRVCLHGQAELLEASTGGCECGKRTAGIDPVWTFPSCSFL